MDLSSFEGVLGNCSNPMSSFYTKNNPLSRPIGDVARSQWTPTLRWLHPVLSRDLSPLWINVYYKSSSAHNSFKWPRMMMDPKWYFINFSRWIHWRCPISIWGRLLKFAFWQVLVLSNIDLWTFETLFSLLWHPNQMCNNENKLSWTCLTQWH